MTYIIIIASKNWHHLEVEAAKAASVMLLLCASAIVSALYMFWFPPNSMKFKGLTIEKLKPRDIPKTSKFARKIINSLAIYNKKARTAFSKELSSSGLRSELKYGAVFVIKNKGGEILGFLNYQPSNSGVGWVDWVLIDDAYRNKGLSSAISKYAFSFAKRHGEHTIWADSRTNNRKAVGLIKKLGFKKLGLFRKAWYKQDYYLWYKNI